MDVKLQEKYAKMWLRTNGWKIPRGMGPFDQDKELFHGYPKAKRMYASAQWKILSEMVKDGIIPIDVLNRVSDEQEGWKPGSSKIKI